MTSDLFDYDDECDVCGDYDDGMCPECGAGCDEQCREDCGCADCAGEEDYLEAR